MKKPAAARLTPAGRFLALALGVMPCAFGYIVLTITSGTQTIQAVRADGAGTQFYLNSQVVAGVLSSLSGTTVITAGSNPAVAVEAAMASWNGVSNSSIHFNTLQTTAAGRNPTDCQNVISLASGSADLSILGYASPGSPGLVAVTLNTVITSAGSFCGSTTALAAGTIFDSDILLNPYFTFSTDSTANTKDIQAVLTHELGHALGMNHSGLLGTTMFPFTAKSQRHLGDDEKAFAAASYPLGAKTLGTLSGTVTIGANPIQFGLVTLIDQNAGRTLGALTDVNGNYSVQAPSGSYIVYAEPFNSFVGPGNIYELSSSTGTLNASQVTTGYEPTFLGTASTPTVVQVAAGVAATASIAVTGTTSVLTQPYYAAGAAGGSGDITSAVLSSGNALTVTSGQSVDIGFTSGGVDATTSLLVFGAGVSVKAGSTRLDPSYPGTLLRTTLVIPAQTTTTLASLWLVKGTSVLSLSGGLVIQPAVPVLSNVQDAESARTVITSGQYVAIYGNNLASTTRTWNANIDFTGGVAAGSPLPTTLDGVTVTVNSLPAAVYFVSPGQINIVAPSNLTSGAASVVVSNGTTPSAALTSATIAQASPSFFIYGAGGNYYPAAYHLNGTLVGDPAVQSGSTKALAGETLVMFANGLGPSPGGVIASVTTFSGPVTVTGASGSNAFTGMAAAALVYAGEFQVNVTLPPVVPSGNYTLTLTVPNGSTSTSGITVVLPVGP